jgi:uncharacterized protein (TIGR02722 family)
MRRNEVKFASLLFVVSLTACGPETRREDPDGPGLTTTGFDRQDIKDTVKTLIAKFLARSPQTDWTPPAASDRPAIKVGKIENFSDEHLDARMVTDLFRESLLNTGTVRFTVDEADKQQVLKELEEQNDSGLYKKAEAAIIGNWTPPEYVLTGRFTNQRKGTADRSVEDVYFVFILSCYDVSSGQKVWIGTKEIAKVKERSGVGY